MVNLLTPTNNDSAILTCRHCGNTTQHNVIHLHTRLQLLEDTQLGNSISYNELFFILECVTCNNIAIFANWDMAEDPYDINNAKQFYPEERELSSSVPRSVRSTGLVLD